MHATTSPTLSQPRAGGVRFLGAALVIAAAVTAGALIAVNLPAASTGTTAGAKTGADIHSAAWLRAHHRGAVVLQTPAESSLRELRRGEIGALGAPGAAAALQTPAQSTLDYWRAYADQRVLAPKTGASFMGGVPGYVMSQSYLNSITPQSVPAVRDPMSYWNSITLRGGLLPSVKANGLESMLVTGVAPAGVLDQLASGNVNVPSIVLPVPTPKYPGKVIDPVDQSHRFAPLAGDWILTAPSPAAAPYMPKLAPQGILHPTLPAGHAKAQTKAAVSAAAGSISFDQLEKLIGPIAFERYFGRDAGNDTPRGISHR